MINKVVEFVSNVTILDTHQFMSKKFNALVTSLDVFVTGKYSGVIRVNLENGKTVDDVESFQLSVFNNLLLLKPVYFNGVKK